MTPAARGWADAVRVHRLVILGSAAAVVLSIGLAQPDGTRRGVAVLVVGLAVVIALSLRSRRVWPLWRATAGVLVAGLLAVLLAVTGGTESAYQDTVVAVMVASALTLPLRLVLVNVAAAVAAAGSPVLYDPAFDAVWATDLGADVGVWLAVTAAAYLQTRLLRQHADDLRESEALQRAFLRATSHELRTPLTAVSGFAETLEHRGEELSGAQRQRMAAQMSANAQRLNALVTDLLDVDRLASGVVNANRASQDLSLLVERVLREIELGGRQVDLDLVPVVAEVDGPKIERVVANLVANAVRYTPPSGTIGIEVGPDGANAIVRVSDEGPGLPTGYEDRIFEPFVQGPERRRDANPGTGLGLTLVKGFVELHGGAVRARRRMPVGSCVEVVLPLSADSDLANPQEGDASAA